VSRLRPLWQTIQRPDLRLRPFALAATAGRCPCGADVESGDPIVHFGSVLDVAPDGSKRVDLSASEWVCDRYGDGGDL
jgi:hypothetical protein